MNDQLRCGLGLGAAAIPAIVLGVPWLATAVLAAAVTFVAVGALLALGGMRADHDHAAGSLQ
jgi:hypothetical protein